MQGENLLPRDHIPEISRIPGVRWGQNTTIKPYLTIRTDPYMPFCVIPMLILLIHLSPPQSLPPWNPCLLHNPSIHLSPSDHDLPHSIEAGSVTAWDVPARRRFLFLSCGSRNFTGWGAHTSKIRIRSRICICSIIQLSLNQCGSATVFGPTLEETWNYVRTTSRVWLEQSAESRASFQSKARPVNSDNKVIGNEDAAFKR